MLTIVENPDSNLELAGRFYDPKELIKSSLKYIDKISKSDSIAYTIWDVYFSGLPFDVYDTYTIFDDNDGLINFGISGVYKNGIVYEFVCPGDDGYNKYNTLTSAKLVVKNDGEVIYFLDGIDKRLNKHVPHEDNSSYWIRYNTEESKKIMQSLGRRIDGMIIRDVKSKKGLFNRLGIERRYDKIRKMISNSYTVLSECMEQEPKECRKIIR